MNLQETDPEFMERFEHFALHEVVAKKIRASRNERDLLRFWQHSSAVREQTHTVKCFRMLSASESRR